MSRSGETQTARDATYLTQETREPGNGTQEASGDAKPVNATITHQARPPELPHRRPGTGRPAPQTRRAARGHPQARRQCTTAPAIGPTGGSEQQAGCARRPSAIVNEHLAPTREEHHVTVRLQPLHRLLLSLHRRLESSLSEEGEGTGVHSVVGRRQHRRSQGKHTS